MRYIAILLMSIIASATPLHAQSCGDDIAGLTRDDDGNYVIVKPKKHQPMPLTANMSIIPASGTKTTSMTAAAKPAPSDADENPVVRQRALQIP